MLKRKKLTRKANKKSFTKKALMTNSKNLPAVTSRGGIRL